MMIEKWYDLIKAKKIRGEKLQMLFVLTKTRFGGSF